MASQAIPAKQLMNKLKHETTKHMNTKLNIAFNKSCKKEKVTPNYVKISIKTKSVSGKRTLKQAKRLWVNNEIKNLYKKSEIVLSNKNY